MLARLIISMLMFAPFTLPSPVLAGEGAPPGEGSLAPAFRLQDQPGTWISLADQRGKWVVLYFYPKDNTPGCTTEACEFRDNIFAFRSTGAIVLGISVDDVASHEQFARDNSLPFPILADLQKQVSKDYGVLHSALGVMEVARRETFIIDPQGRVARHYRAVEAKGHSQLVLADLKALQASRPQASQLAPRAGKKDE
jgi:peroxiredoxin Q/BCP